jgi:hypothetical protein
MSFSTLRRAEPALCLLDIGETATLAKCRRDEVDLAMRKGELKFYRYRGERFVDPPDCRAWILARSGRRRHGK